MGGGERGCNFELQMYFYYTNRGANIYLTPDGNTPCSATGCSRKCFKTYLKVQYLLYANCLFPRLC